MTYPLQRQPASQSAVPASAGLSAWIVLLQLIQRLPHLALIPLLAGPLLWQAHGSLFKPTDIKVFAERTSHQASVLCQAGDEDSCHDLQTFKL